MYCILSNLYEQSDLLTAIKRTCFEVSLCFSVLQPALNLPDRSLLHSADFICEVSVKSIACGPASGGPVSNHCAPKAGGWASIPDRELDLHAPTKSLCAATKDPIR